MSIPWPIQTNRPKATLIAHVEMLMLGRLRPHYYSASIYDVYTRIGHSATKQLMSNIM